MNSVTVDEIYGAEAETDQVARLPGEGPDHAGISEYRESPEQHDPNGLSAEPQATPRKASKGNVALYAGVGLVALLMAGGYFYLRPSTNPHPMLAAQAPATIPAPLAPAASLAKVPVAHLPAAVIHQKFVPQPVATQLSELDAFQAGDQAPTPAVAPTHVSAGSGEATGPHKTVSATATPAKVPPGNSASSNRPAAPMTMTVSNAAAPPKPAPNTPGSPVSGTPATSQKSPLQAPAAVVAHAGNPSAGTDSPATATKQAGATLAAVTQPAAATLAAAQAGALSAAQQTNLYQLVTQLGSLERTDEIRQAVLAGQVQQLTLLVSGKMADYDRRLSMLEAQTAVSGAVQAASSTTVSTAIATAPAPAPATSQSEAAPAPSAASPTTVPSSAPATPVQYQVQAASSGLAMLSAPGGGQPIEVQTGDTIPGYGKVLGVVQQGASWVVQTQSGNIQ
jgi:hypothetical protein